MTSQRLPVPGSDDGDWGDILNDFLEVSLNTDGTLQPSALTNAGAELTSNKGVSSGYAGLNGSGLVPSTQLGSGTASSSNYLRGDGTWVPISGSTPAATGSSLGTVELAGDLGGGTAGSATSPQVTSTHLAAALPINQGGTGSTSQNFVDLSAAQTIAGTKTFSSTIAGSISGNAATATTASSVTTNADLSGDVTSVGNVTTLTSSANVESIIAANAAVAAKAPSASPTFTGKVTTPALQVTTGAGTTGQVLTSSDTNGNVSWASPVSGDQALIPTSVKTTSQSPYAAAAGDFVPVDTTSGNVSITLPSAPADKTRIGIKMVIQGGNNTVAINRGGSSDVFNKAGGAITETLTLLNQGMLLQYAASTNIWYIQADDLALAQLDARYSPSGLYVPTPSGTPTEGQVPVVSTISPLATGWGTPIVTVPGVVSDGVTDNWSTIQNFLNLYVSATNAGTEVILPPGLIAISKPLVIPSGVKLRGSGAPPQSIYEVTPPPVGSVLIPTSSWAGASGNAILPNGVTGGVAAGGTLSVSSNTGFSSSGGTFLALSLGGWTTGTYGGTSGGTSLTNVNGFGTGVATWGAAPVVNATPVSNTTVGVATSVGIASSGQSLPQSSLTAVSTTGFPASGNLLVQTEIGWCVVSYTAISSNVFTGCTGGTGKIITGCNIVSVPTGLTAASLLPYMTPNGVPVVVSTSSSHGYAVGQAVIVTNVGFTGVGVGSYQPNGVFQVLQTPSSTTFGYIMQGPNTGSYAAGGATAALDSLVVLPNPYAKLAELTVWAGSTVSRAVTIGSQDTSHENFFYYGGIAASLDSDSSVPSNSTRTQVLNGYIQQVTNTYGYSLYEWGNNWRVSELYKTNGPAFWKGGGGSIVGGRLAGGYPYNCRILKNDVFNGVAFDSAAVGGSAIIANQQQAEATNPPAALTGCSFYNSVNLTGIPVFINIPPAGVSANAQVGINVVGGSVDASASGTFSCVISNPSTTDLINGLVLSPQAVGTNPLWISGSNSTPYPGFLFGLVNGTNGASSSSTTILSTDYSVAATTLTSPSILVLTLPIGKWEISASISYVQGTSAGNTDFEIAAGSATVTGLPVSISSHQGASTPSSAQVGPVVISVTAAGTVVLNAYGAQALTIKHITPTGNFAGATTMTALPIAV